MADAQKMKNAQAVYSTLCAMLDGRNWRYRKDEENLKVSCSATGDDLSIDVRFTVDAERDVVMFLSQLDLTVPQGMEETMAQAVSMINYSMVAGSFDYSPAKGIVCFRMTSSYRDSLIGKEALEYMLVVSCGTVDQYNDKLLMIAKGNMSLDELNEFINK